jgi:hypothetical protein
MGVLVVLAYHRHVPRRNKFMNRLSNRSQIEQKRQGRIWHLAQHSKVLQGTSERKASDRHIS